MKKHKIRNVELDICCHEQLIVYNGLFSNSMFEKSIAIDLFKKNLMRCFNKRNRNYDIEYILSLFSSSFDRYIEKRRPICCNYKEIGNIIY